LWIYKLNMNECEVMNQLGRLLLVLVIQSGVCTFWDLDIECEWMWSCETCGHVIKVFWSSSFFFFVYSFNCFIRLVSEQVILCRGTIYDKFENTRYHLWYIWKHQVPFMIHLKTPSKNPRYHFVSSVCFKMLLCYKICYKTW